MSTSPHITAVERQAKLKRLATEKFRVVDGKVEKYTTDFSAQDVKDAIAAAIAAAVANLKTGDKYGDSIYLGVWEPKDHDGNSLSRKFNVFAAPHDLPDTMTYTDAVKHLAGLKDWNGFDGTDYANEEEIHAALKDGSYNGGWFIPPRELLSGTELGGGPGTRENEPAQPDNLFDYRNEGAFKGTFTTVASGDRHSLPEWYWSSSRSPESYDYMWNVLFLNRSEYSNSKEDSPELPPRPPGAETMSTSPHITAVERQAKLKRLASEKFRVVDGKVETYKAEPPAQDIKTVVAAAAAAEKQGRAGAAAKQIAAASPGQFIEGHGIFIGTWAPKDKEGKSLGKIFNIFAAPENLPGQMRYADALKQISRMKNWHGHDGTNYRDDKELYDALRQGTYNGGWFIPTFDIFRGTDIRNLNPVPYSIVACQDTDNLRRLFDRTDFYGSVPWYWSCTPDVRYPKDVHVVMPPSREGTRGDKKGTAACLPVRLEPKP